MRAFRNLLIRFTAPMIASITSLPAAVPPELGWPEVVRENKPWTRWWWPGSAVDRPNLTWQLEQLAAAGIGGVEITPIYGARGFEDRYIDFLSPPWMAMLEHAGREAERLGLGIDMATGTGWPFGGPWVQGDDVAQRAILAAGRLAGEPTGMKVKRAAPGGEGFVVDPYSPDALRRYLAPFEKAFAGFPRGLLRGQFHDSFEYHQASWSPRLPAVFREMHGYDVDRFAAELTSRDAAQVTSVDRDTLARIKADYRETLARLHLDYLRTWVEWSHRHGFIVRNQSHGAPGNLLDLYANADIAETEVFGSTPFPIPGLRRANEDIRHDQDLPDSLVMRMASSAAHVAGHNLSSSESATWLREHWKVALAHVKPELDRIFADGINHIFYHGTVFSPRDAPWPGWLFYASTQFQPNNPWWDDFSALNRYVARIQSILQRGRPDNDILLYWPLADVWDNPNGLMIQLGVHDVQWLTGQPVGRLARGLMDRGYSFDYVSDSQLEQTRMNAGAIQTPGARYRAIVVPAVRRMPVETVQQLARLAKAGASVIVERLPEDVPGYGRLESRRSVFRTAVGELGENAIIDADVYAALDRKEVPREPIAESGISFIRRAHEHGTDYFFANLTGAAFDGWASLARPMRSAAILDPLTGKHGAAALQTDEATKARVYLQLAPGESLILRTSMAASAPAAPWAYRRIAGPPVPIRGKWSVTFLKGGPNLPPGFETVELSSWTELGGSEARRFAGTARYETEFELSDLPAGDWLLDLGDVRESARVRINDREVATVWSVPFRVRIGAFVRPGRNVLTVDVTNLAANRIRDLDERGVPWKIMHEINFVNINYRPFDASGWAITPSGLLGPVTLTPLRVPSP